MSHPSIHPDRRVFAIIRPRQHRVNDNCNGDTMTFFRSTLCAVSVFAAVSAAAHDGILAGNVSPVRADSHAPIGVMGDHLHGEGEWMVSYRFMSMSMEDNLRGDSSLAPDEIVTSVVNPFGSQPNVRVVPLEMTTDMHMLGLMYAPSDTVTLMGMVNYLDKRMDHQTYLGMMGTAKLGQFTTEASGFGDTKVSALVRLLDRDGHKLHLNLGASLPTGSIDEEGQVLTPMNTRMTLRLPYAMQLGSGTWDLEPGVTYSGHRARVGWGAQYGVTVRLGENDEDYTLGDEQRLTGWTSYRWADWISTSVRFTYTDRDSIDGRDPRIAAPVTTANPDNYGGERFDAGIGVNLVGQEGGIRGHRLALEYQWTLDQDVDGVQMEMQSMLTAGYQYAF